MIHIHTDVENLIYFSDKNGISPDPARLVAYAMQGADIVKVFYLPKQAIEFYELNAHKEDLPVIYYWDESKWNKIQHQKSTNHVIPTD